MALNREDADAYAAKVEAKERAAGPKIPGNRGPGRSSTQWAEKSRWKMSLPEFVASLDIGPASQYEEKPKGFKRDGPMPYQPIWLENAFILPMSLLPLAIQSLVYYLKPNSAWSPWSAYLLYHLSFIIFAITNMKRLHFYAEKYGVLDEQHRARDIIGDTQVAHLGWSILLYTSLRSAGPMILAYKPNVMPLLGLSLMSLPKIMAWEIVIDLFFYIYHSATHRVDALWFIHRAHHGTKHPTAILSILADDYQEIIEVILCPTLASWVVPLTFAEGYIAICYLLYVEMLGHSGIRAYWPHPLLTPILKPFDMELAVEDHDLHHRGGRGGQNYGKQTRIWDKLGNSIGQRVECTPDVVDSSYYYSSAVGYTKKAVEAYKSSSRQVSRQGSPEPETAKAS